MANVVDSGGIEGFPSLQSICDLFRSSINDTFNKGSGQVAPDDAPWIKPFLNSAIRDLYSDLRITGDMRVVVDNYILTGLPAIVAADPTIQTVLNYNGYYNGTTWNGNFRLPADLMWVMKLWQRPTGSGANFYPMHVAPSGLQGVYQVQSFCEYEVRGANEIWFNGAIEPTDLRIRYKRLFTDITADALDFPNTYVPIQDCTNAVAMKMVARYALRLTPELLAMANSEEVKYTNKLKAEVVLSNQNKEYERQPFAGGH